MVIEFVEDTMTDQSKANSLTDLEGLRVRLAQNEQELNAIRERANSEYRHESGEQYTPMLRDVRFLLGELNVINEFWESAEKEMDEIRNCDKCELCEDHHG